VAKSRTDRSRRRIANKTAPSLPPAAGPLILALAVSIPDLALRLEHEFQSQLALAGSDGRIADHAEVRIAYRGVRRTEHGMVEGILRLQAQSSFICFVAGTIANSFRMDKLVLKKKGVRTVPTVRGALPKV